MHIPYIVVEIVMAWASHPHILVKIMSAGALLTVVSIDFGGGVVVVVAAVGNNC